MTFLAGVLLLLSNPTAAAFPGDSLYARPGQFFTASDGTKLNFYCMGKGSPTVVFESGEGDWSPTWASVQPAISQRTRTCSYDRSGSGFSSLGALPTSARRFADELHSALRNGGVRGPYILVGHAGGGDIVRIFADRYMADVAGMVLIDPAERDVETNHDLDDLWQGIDERNRGELAFCRDSVAARKPFPLTPPSDHPGWTCLNYSYRGVPEPRLSKELNDSMVQTMSTRVEMWQALFSAVGERAGDKEYLQTHRRSLGSRPLRVILAAYEIPPTSRMPAEQRIRFNEGFRNGGMNLLNLSTNAKLITTDAGAFVQWEKPDIVIDAIREVYDHASGRRK